jgi:hypothetical protein
MTEHTLDGYFLGVDFPFRFFSLFGKQWRWLSVRCQTAALCAQARLSNHPVEVVRDIY